MSTLSAHRSITFCSHAQRTVCNLCLEQYMKRAHNDTEVVKSTVRNKTAKCHLLTNDYLYFRAFK